MITPGPIVTWPPEQVSIQSRQWDHHELRLTSIHCRAQLPPITQAAWSRGGHLDKTGVLLERRRGHWMLSKQLTLSSTDGKSEERRIGATLQITVKIKLKTSDGDLKIKVGPCVALQNQLMHGFVTT